MGVILRGGSFHLRRRVPRRYRAVEPREVIWASLHTDSRSVAETKAARAWGELIEAWEAKLHGDTEDAEARFEAARELARVRGFRYLNAGQVARLPASDLVARVEAIGAPNGRPDRREAETLLGTAPEPALTLSTALEAYWTLAKDKTVGKSRDQLRRWRNPRLKAVRNFIEVVGDKPIDGIGRDDMLEFRQWWLERIMAGEVTANSANKDLTHLGEVLRRVNRLKQLGLDLPLGELSFRDGERRTRPPFSDDWIGERLLAPGALEGLNAEARAILLVMVNTGARPSEIAALTGASIRLEAETAHIAIAPEGRQLKSAHARRVIPLLGVSLEALRAFPGGFPRYRSSAAGLSATVNKYLRANGLAETPAHTLYSLRHSFEDRMLAAGIDDRIRRDLLGHRLDRERYGAGASLEHVASLLAPVAF